MQTEFENQYLDVLQNIEWSLLSFAKDHPELCEHNMLHIVEQVLAYYKSEKRGNLEPQSKLTNIHQEIFERVTSICEWKLGKLPPPNKKIACNLITIEELLLCLRRIEKSIKFWTKQRGRKGYIAFATSLVLATC